MIAREFLALLLRRWYLVIVVGLVTGATALLPMVRPEVYWSRVTVVVLSPPTVGVNTLTELSPVALASLVVMDVNHAPSKILASRSSAILLGLDIRHGTLVQMRNSGGQWAINVQEPYIEIEATDSSPEAVQARIDAAVSEIEQALRRREESFGVSTKDRAQLQMSPPEAIVLVAMPSKARAVGASLLAAACVTGVVVTGADRLLLWRRATKVRRRSDSAAA